MKIGLNRGCFFVAGGEAALADKERAARELGLLVGCRRDSAAQDSGVGEIVVGIKDDH